MRLHIHALCLPPVVVADCRSTPEDNLESNAGSRPVNGNGKTKAQLPEAKSSLTPEQIAAIVAYERSL